MRRGRANQGDDDSFKDLYIQYNWLVRGIARKLGVDPDETSQAVWYLVWRKLPLCGEVLDHFEYWLRRVTRNVALRMLIGQARRVRVEETAIRGGDLREGYESESSTFFQIDKSTRIEMVRSSCRQLKPHYREIIKYIFWDDLKIAEIARRLNTPSSTIRARYKRALKKLRFSLKDLA